MLIEFLCPVCRAQLSVESNLAGGQLDCPKCQELIIIPLSPPALDPSKTARVSDLLKHDSPDEAIIRAVKPYREELLAKRNQLLQAIEEIKLRNERIRELETNGLQVQKELWALEADFEDRKDDFRRAREEIIELKKKLNRVSGSLSSATLKELNAGLADDLRGSEELREELKKVSERARETEARLQAELSGLREEVQRARAGEAAPSPMDPAQDRLLLLEGEIGRVRDQADFLQGGVQEQQHLTAKVVLLLAQALGHHEDLQREREAVRADVQGLREQLQEVEALTALAGKLGAGLTRLDRAAAGRKKQAATGKEAKAREAESVAALAALRKEVERLEKEHRAQGERLNQESAERTRLQAALEEARKAAAAAGKAATEVADLRARLAEEEKARLTAQKALDKQSASTESAQKLLLETQAALAQERKLGLEAALAEKRAGETALAAIRQTVAALTAERDALQKELAAARSEGGKSGKLKDDLARVEKELAEHKRRALAESDRLRSLDAARADAEQRLTELTARAATAEKNAAEQLETARRQFTEASAERDRLAVALEQARRAEKDLQSRVGDLGAAQSRLQSERGGLEERIRQLDKELEVARAAAGKSQTEFQAAQRQASSAEAEIKRQTDVLTEERRRAEERLQEAQRQAQQFQKQADAERERLAGQVARLEEDRQALKARADSLAQEKSGLEGQLAAAAAEVTEWRGKADRAAAEHAALERTRADLARELESLRREAASLREKSGVAETELKLRADLETQLTRQTQALESALREQELLKSQLTTAQREKELTADGLERREKAYGDLVRENQNLSKRLDKLAAELGTHQQAADTARREAIRLEGELRKAQERAQKLEQGGEESGLSANAFQALRQKLAEAETKIRGLQDRAKSLENKFEFDQGLGERLIRSEERNRQLAGRIADLEVGLKEQELLTKKFQTRADKVEPLEHDLRRAREEADGHAGRLRELEAALERERSSSQDATQRLKAGGEASQALAQARGEVARLQGEIARLQEESTRRETQLAALNHQVAQLQAGAAGGGDRSREAELEQEIARLRKADGAPVEADAALARVGALEVQTRDLSLENSRLKNTVRTLSENLKAQWKKRSPNFQG
jgi:chromosome segregation ATPase